MALTDELLAIEKGFWTRGSDYFATHADGECLVAFPQMAGVMTNSDLAETARDPNRWRDLELELKGHVQPNESFAMLTYEAKAIRSNGDDYRALVSTAYIRRADGWKMVFHAQAPI